MYKDIKKKGGGGGTMENLVKVSVFEEESDTKTKMSLRNLSIIQRLV